MRIRICLYSNDMKRDKKLVPFLHSNLIHLCAFIRNDSGQHNFIFPLYFFMWFPFQTSKGPTYIYSRLQVFTVSSKPFRGATDVLPNLGISELVTG